jgi:hypothetical protein
MTSDTSNTSDTIIVDETPQELLGLYDDNSNIDILHKGRILGICSVILYIDKRIEGKIQYELADNLTLFGADVRYHNLLPILESGEFTISSFYKAGSREIEATALVDELLKMLEERYAAVTLQLYQQEIIHGRQ